MRASPAFQLTIRHFGVWRCAVGALIICALAALLAFGRGHDTSPQPLIHDVAMIVAALAIVSGASLLRRQAVSLRWDTQHWRLGPASAVGEEPWSGRIDVSLDLGGWMLLRFEHEAATARRSAWVPIQRRGIEPSWHALRCAVYSARLVQGPDSGPSSATTPEPHE